ncbi:MAG: ATP-binding cassette domain-containing protein [Holophagales bacterium]|nr:ATP-binding cassette domain-containing protein [Holophagales bacterium]
MIPRVRVEETPVVCARNVDFFFGNGELAKQVLFEIDLSIERREIVLLTGPSGGGKTTLLTLIAALRTLRHGEMRVLGCDLRAATQDALVHLRREIGFIFQQHHLLGFLTARMNVELMFQLHPEVPAEEARRRAEETLCRVGLQDHLDSYPAGLSGGQMQRVAIARALACGPSLVLADEPTAALDGRSGRQVVDLLAELAKDHGCPVLMVTHDSRVLDVADRVVHLEDGRLGTPTSRSTASDSPL